MKRLLLAATTAAMFAALMPAATAHTQAIEDATNDALWGEQSGLATGLDITGASFTDTKKSYVISVEIADLSLDKLCGMENCNPEPSGAGIVDSDFYRVKNEKSTAYYYVTTAQEEGKTSSVLFSINSKTHEYKYIGVVPSSIEGSELVVTIPRKLVKGHKKGHKLFWNARTSYWNETGSDTCTYDTDPNAYWFGACVDWMPSDADAEHKLKN